MDGELAPKIFDSPENVIEVNEYTSRLLMSEILCSFFNVVHLGNSMIIYDLDYSSDDHESSDIMLALYISTCSCFMLAISLNIRYVIALKWRKAKHYVVGDETILSSGIWKDMIAETMISMIGPHFFLQSLVYRETNTDLGIEVEYRINHILCTVVWFKCYGIL